MNMESSATNKSILELEISTLKKLTLGKLIWAIRKTNQKTQVEFAQILQISKQHLCDIEHDRKSISPKLAAKYAAILNYPSIEFIQLALQGIVDRDHLNVIVAVSEKEDSSILTVENH